MKSFFCRPYFTQRGGAGLCIWGIFLLFCLVAGLIWPVRDQLNPVLMIAATTLWILLLIGLWYVSRAHEKYQATPDWKTLAQCDALTHVANRRGLQDALAQLHTQQSCLLLLIDIDDFKAINDQYGHNVGDRVLCHLASCLQQAVRHNDVVARWGGDEFIVVLVDALPHVAELFDHRVQQLLNSMHSDKSVDSNPTFSWTTGVAILPPRCELSNVIAAASKNLLLNKNKRQ